MKDGVWVEAPGRLHLGMIDLRGDLGRRFGGLGAALVHPSVALEAQVATEVTASGPEARRAAEFARRFLRHHGLKESASIRVHRVVPAHVGLGSGTQLGLAVARALAELFQVRGDAPALAAAVGRARRSAVGTWLFERGGFVLEGGRRERDGAAPLAPPAPPAPLLFHHPMPEAWRCIIAIPDVPRGLSGKTEAAAFRKLTPPSAQKVGQIARLALMAALPALVEQDLEAFGRAITEIQKRVGDCFKEVQGGRFAHPKVASLISSLERWGAPGVGQSSWGPAVFALAANEGEADRLAGRAREEMKFGGFVCVTPFDNVGGRCLRL